MFSNEETLGGLLDTSWIEVVTRKPRHNLKLGTFSSILQPPERGEGLEMELVIDHAYVRKPPSNLNSMGFRKLPGW